MGRDRTDGSLRYNSGWCKDCGICAAFCPRGVLKMIHGKMVIGDEADCIGCNLCGQLCPDYAIFFDKGDGDER